MRTTLCVTAHRIATILWAVTQSVVRMLRAAAFAVLLGRMITAQTPPACTLQIDLQNNTIYIGDVSDYSKLASDANPVPFTGPYKTFSTSFVIADIVAVNGAPVKGTMIERTTFLGMSQNPPPGAALADTAHLGLYDWSFEILGMDGTPIGCIRTSGMAGMPPGGLPAGAAPLSALNSPAIVGGAGAFLGARGSHIPNTTSGNVAAAYIASTAEDPVNRRLRGGGAARFTLSVVPMFWPEVVTTSVGPAVFHADLSPVTAAKPAHPGEILILQTTGLGPTRPELGPRNLFSADPLQEVNSPVDVTVNGKPAEVINKIGWPGTRDTYRLDIRIPNETAPGRAVVGIAAAWITGREFAIPVQ
jgi:uncharacterized protein (TIGR03437 family)